MTEEERAPFVNETQQKLAKYREQMTKYKTSDSYASFQKVKSTLPPMKGKKMKKPKDPNMPRKPLSGYFRFIKHFREQNPEMSITESTKAAAPKWKGFSEEERAVYNDKAAEEKRKYEIILEEYHGTKEYAEYEETLLAFKKAKYQRRKELLKLS